MTQVSELEKAVLQRLQASVRQEYAEAEARRDAALLEGGRPETNSAYFDLAVARLLLRVIDRCMNEAP